MSLPYYKRFPRDFLEGTIGLSFEVKGAFAILLDLIYIRSGRLPDDARFIAGQLGCSVRKWSAVREELIARGKIQVSDGIISNFRADYLTEETRKYQDKQAEIAQKPRKNNEVHQPKPSQPEPEPDKKNSTTYYPKKPPEGFDDFWKLYPTKKAKPNALKAYLKALEKTDHATLIAAVTAQSRWRSWQEGFIPHAATWLNAERWSDEPEGPRVAAKQNPGGGGRGDTSFADIIARRERDRGEGVAVPGERGGVSGDGLDWRDGAIDGELVSSDCQGGSFDDAPVPF